MNDFLTSKRRTILLRSAVLTVLFLMMAIIPVRSGKASVSEAFLFAIATTAVVGCIIFFYRWYEARRIRRWCAKQNFQLLNWRKLYFGELPEEWNNTWSSENDSVEAYEVIVREAQGSNPHVRILVAWHDTFDSNPQFIFKDNKDYNNSRTCN